MSQGFARKLFTAIATAAVTSVSAIVPAAAAVTSSDVGNALDTQCRSKEVIVIPGGANTFPGIPQEVPHGLLTAEVGIQLDILPDTNVRYVSYQAVPFLASTYGESFANGYAATQSAINQVVTRCPDSQIAIVGYSEGADVASHVLNDASKGVGSLNEDNFGGASLYSTPHHGAEGAVKDGGAPADAHGVLGALEGGYGELAPRVKEFCKPGDIICDFSEKFNDLVPILLDANISHGSIGTVEELLMNAGFAPTDILQIINGHNQHLSYTGEHKADGVQWIANQ